MTERVYSKCALVFTAVTAMCFSQCFAVTSNIIVHGGRAGKPAGETKNTVVGSQGNIQLARESKVLAEKLDDVWSINSIVVNRGEVFIGTSPNGQIYKLSLGELDLIYPEMIEETIKADVNDPNDPNDPNAVEQETHLKNEHIFAMAKDISGRLLAGISGDDCRLVRFEKGQVNTVLDLSEPNDPNAAKYIFAVTVGKTGDIYLGTGPHGRIYKLDPMCKKSELVYEAKDKNILSVTEQRDGFIYAGSDGRGLIYRIDPETKSAEVLYDSDQQEITSLILTDDGSVYAAATSAKIAASQGKIPPAVPAAGRPEGAANGKLDTKNGGLKLNIPNSKQPESSKPNGSPMAAMKKDKKAGVSFIYKINSDGFVTDVFSQPAVLFCMGQYEDGLITGTGNNAEMFSIELDSEDVKVTYKDEQASQITTLQIDGDDIYLGTANPAKLIKLSKNFAAEGSFTSELIDAAQPARWGKLQIEADIPKDCTVLMSARSGNVSDVNDPTFSQWSEPVMVTEPVLLDCPLGRFCQYKLILKSNLGLNTAVVKQIAAAYMIPNIAPRIRFVTAVRVKAPGKDGIFKIDYMASDDNKDKLVYKIDFRKIGRDRWIELEEETATPSFEWDTKTVEDDRYEIRVTASDIKSNTSATEMTGTRISDEVIVDNSGPEIKKLSLKIRKDKVILKISVTDAFSVISSVEYTINSSSDWIGTLPDDMVYDTIEEYFTIEVDDLDDNEHIITVKASDCEGNVTYKTYEVEAK